NFGELRVLFDRPPKCLLGPTDLVGRLPTTLGEAGDDLLRRQPRDGSRRTGVADAPGHFDLSFISALISWMRPGPRRFSSSAVSACTVPNGVCLWAATRTEIPDRAPDDGLILASSRART